MYWIQPLYQTDSESCKARNYNVMQRTKDATSTLWRTSQMMFRTIARSIRSSKFLLSSLTWMLDQDATKARVCWFGRSIATYVSCSGLIISLIISQDHLEYRNPAVSHFSLHQIFRAWTCLGPTEKTVMSRWYSTWHRHFSYTNSRTKKKKIRPIQLFSTSRRTAIWRSTIFLLGPPIACRRSTEASKSNTVWTSSANLSLRFL